MSFSLFTPPNNIKLNFKTFRIKTGDWLDGIAVRSPNWLGDAVMALPAMYSLKKILPEKCGFFIVTPENLSPLYESIPWINYVLTVGDGHTPWTKEQLNELKSLRPGVGMLFVNSLKSAYYFKKANIRYVFGASNGIRNIFLKKSFKVKWHKKNGYEECHQSYKYLQMTYSMGAPEWDNIYPEFRVPEPDKTANPLLNNISEHKNLLVIQPGAAYGPAKRWPTDYFREICKYWINNKGSVAIVGTKMEAECSKELRSGMGENRNIIDLTGKTSMNELMYTLKHSLACVCNDSGVMHLASALNLKGVAIFGSTDPFATGPISGKWIVMLERQKCSPCFSRECINSNKDYKCLRDITPENVIKALEYLT